MFIGNYTHSVDEKQRLKLPSSFRQKIAEDNVVLAKGDGDIAYVTLYPMRVWEEFMEPLRKKALRDHKYKRYVRMKSATAAEVKIDSQGRVLVPKVLLEYSGAERDVEIIGVGDYIELWAPENFEKEVAESREIEGDFLDYMASQERE